MTGPPLPSGHEIGSAPPYGAPADPADAATLAASLACPRCHRAALLRPGGLCPACTADTSTDTGTTTGTGAGPADPAEPILWPAVWLGTAFTDPDADAPGPVSE